jgi:hypothetical protein
MVIVKCRVNQRSLGYTKFPLDGQHYRSFELIFTDRQMWLLWLVFVFARKVYWHRSLERFILKSWLYIYNFSKTIWFHMGLFLNTLYSQLTSHCSKRNLITQQSLKKPRWRSDGMAFTNFTDKLLVWCFDTFNGRVVFRIITLCCSWILLSQKLTCNFDDNIRLRLISSKCSFPIFASGFYSIHLHYDCLYATSTKENCSKMDQTLRSFCNKFPSLTKILQVS